MDLSFVCTASAQTRTRQVAAVRRAHEVEMGELRAVSKAKSLSESTWTVVGRYSKCSGVDTLFQIWFWSPFTARRFWTRPSLTICPWKVWSSSMVACQHLVAARQPRTGGWAWLFKHSNTCWFGVAWGFGFQPGSTEIKASWFKHCCWQPL